MVVIFFTISAVKLSRQPSNPSSEGIICKLSLNVIMKSSNALLVSLLFYALYFKVLSISLSHNTDFVVGA